MQLIANNDLLNLEHLGRGDRAERALRRGGVLHAGAGHRLLQHAPARRIVIGQIIGAVELRHRPPRPRPADGGGVASLGVVGGTNKAGGCTGIPTPVGDFYAIDYVAHEMGHQFGGNHPFNGNQLELLGAATATPPPRSSRAAARRSWRTRASACTDDLQPHSDPYFSERSQQEITTYTSSTQAAINEVQTVSLRHFGGGNEVQKVTFGPGYQPAATIQPLTRRDQRRAERDFARRRAEETATRSRSRPGDSRAHAAAR